jgi:hypothetical protein
MGTLVRRESPAEYFKEMVEAALDHQRTEASEVASSYLVNLLADVARGGGPLTAPGDREPIGVQFVEALRRSESDRASRLRQVADRSLFVAGFFSDSLRRSSVDVDYYVALGRGAYRVLASDDASRGEVFGELGARFVRFVDVLAEISERTTIVSDHDLLRLYERWLRTGSRRDADLLVERGIVPNETIGDRFLQ